VKLSVIVVTKNGAQRVVPCLDSIAAALNRAAPLDAEILVVDNGSTDDTSILIRKWAKASAIPAVAMLEPRPGRSRARNLAVRVSKGDLLAFTDDDCRLHPEYVNDLLRHDAADTELVLRGGRIELGDPSDLPYTINTSPTPKRWHISLNSTRHDCIAGELNGCNMAMRRALVERLGPFDENFGPGSRMGSGDDAEYFFRAYAASVTLEYVPDMVVLHHHGRKTAAEGRALFRRYSIGWGAVHAKYLFRHYSFYREKYDDLRELMAGNNAFLADIGFSRTDKLMCEARGALRYFAWVLRDPASGRRCRRPS
jgi:glycosyltransferase involved in cell wall biosynthesis